MKRVVFLISILILSLQANSQGRLGYSASQILDEFSQPDYNLENGYDNDGDYFIKVKYERADVFYYFKTSDSCYLTLVAPESDGSLNSYVEAFNNRYVIISSVNWKSYSAQGISDIKLYFPQSGRPYFLWSIPKK
ncbi:MAG: hypothetical protein U1C46_01460 [Bacteroidales bacterium]|nr:hypothetical protein [Bacteroidales bacterium]